MCLGEIGWPVLLRPRYVNARIAEMEVFVNIAGHRIIRISII